MSETHEPPRRARRKPITPVTGSLAAVIVAAGGVIGGVHVQKSQAATSTAGGMRGAGMPTGGMPGGGGPPGAQGATGGADSTATAGTVAYTKGSTLYVKDAEGNTITVRVKSTAKVDRTASTDATDVQPGDSVVVQGDANAKGTVTATSITATEHATAG